VLLAGCYRPNGLDPCVTACGPGVDRACPSGLTCDSLGLCKAIDMAGDCPPLDGAIVFEDAEIDAPLSPSAVCFGDKGAFFRTCIDPMPVNTFTPTNGMVIDTASCAALGGYLQPQAKPPAVCVIAAANIVLNNGVTLRVIGGRPLALFATTAMTISGTIDVASHAIKGAGSNSGADCVASPGASGGGGGAGGSFVAAGGAGGKAESGAVGGGPPPMVPIDRVRGGCNGGNGGKATGAGGTAGLGGGGVYLMTPGMLTITASAIINASGGGGGAPERSSGGGGGGTGGFIGIQAGTYTIDPNARVFAIGGGGASGGNATSTGNVGLEASDPTNTGMAVAPSGAGAGGSGTAANGGIGGSAATNQGGAGGGGGGAGGVIGFEGPVPANTGTWRPAPVTL
jgi:hypothetical protein